MCVVATLSPHLLQFRLWPDHHTAGMHMRKASSPNLDVSLRTTEVIGLCALSPVRLAAQALLGADVTHAEARVCMLTRELAQQQHGTRIFPTPHDASLFR